MVGFGGVEENEECEETGALASRGVWLPIYPIKVSYCCCCTLSKEVFAAALPERNL